MKRVSPEEMLQGAMQADVVVFHRPDDAKKVQAAKLLQQAGKKVVFDNDDTYKPNTGVPTNMQSLNGEELLKEINKNLDEFITIADLVTTTTDFLADEYRQLNDNVIVLPNMVDPDDWEDPEENETDKVRVGLVGSVLSNDDYLDIVPLLNELNERKDVQLVIFGLPAQTYKKASEIYAKELEFWHGYDIEWQPFVEHAEYNDTLTELRLDIMLIPRHESYFNKCKSNVKFLEAAMCKVPVIATSFADGKSPYDKDLNGENGILIKDKADWVKETMALIADKPRRKKMGQNAYDYVMEHYNIHTKSYLWEEAYKSIL